MDQLIRLLNTIKVKYGAYIGYKSISSLAMFIAGFECAAYELMGNRINFDAKFQKYVMHVYRKMYENEDCDGKHWSTILADETTDAQAFDVFFTHLENFITTDF